MNDNDILIIRELIDSYQKQYGWYEQLRVMDQKIMSRLILSRGDMHEMMNSFEKKKSLIDNLETERTRTSDAVQHWQKIKSTFPVCEDTDELNAILEKTTNAIKGFLDEEEKIKKYIQGVVKKESSQFSQ
jgi:Tfp pilus tip-associated adhesin PilY1